MKTEDRADFVTALVGIYDLYQAKLTQPAIAIWWRVLMQEKFSIVESALRRHVENEAMGGKLPLPSDILMHVRKIKEARGIQ